MLSGKFTHRPISVTVEEVVEMDTVRDMPEAGTAVMVNVKLDRKRAMALFEMLQRKLNTGEGEFVDLVTFSLKGSLK